MGSRSLTIEKVLDDYADLERDTDGRIVGFMTSPVASHRSPGS